MRKYFFVFKITVQKALMYRGRNLVWAIIGCLSPLLMISVWVRYYADGKSINGYTIEQLIGYYLIVLMISMWMSAVSEHVEEDIKDGNLSNYIIKPFDYMWHRIFWEISWYTVKFATYALPAVVLLFVFARPVVANFLASGIFNIAITGLSFVLSYLISFGVSLVVGYLGFFTSSTNGFKHLFNMLNELLTGRLVPVTMYPVWLQGLVAFLPFKYMVYFPTQLIVGGHDIFFALNGVGIQIAWVFGLYLISKLMWNKGIAKFSAVGI